MVTTTKKTRKKVARKVANSGGNKTTGVKLTLGQAKSLQAFLLKNKRSMKFLDSKIANAV